MCHGSLLNEEDVEGIKNPVLFLYSANDQQIPDEKREKFQGILKTKSFPAEGVYYPDQACPLTHPPLVPNDIIRSNHTIETCMPICRGRNECKHRQCDLGG